MNETRSEVAVIGAGPIGLEMAAALKKAGIDYAHFERGQIGHTISWFPPLMRFFSGPDRIAICGVPIPKTDQSKCSREEYLAYLRGIVEQFDLQVRTYEPVKRIEVGRVANPPAPDHAQESTKVGRVANPPTPDHAQESTEVGRVANPPTRDRTQESTEVGQVGNLPDYRFTLHTEWRGEQRLHRCNKVILAVGDMDKPQLLGLPGEDLPHVSHYFEDPHKYFRCKVLVVGGKNSAVEAAIKCYLCGADVTLSYRRAAFDPEHIKYWLLPEMENRIKRGEIRALFETVPKSFRPGWTTMESLRDGSTFELETDFVLLMTGYLADTTLFEMAGVALRDDSERGLTGCPVLDEETMETNVAGLYVAGTATAGSQQSYRVFIENCHIHIARIVAHLKGDPPPEGETGPGLAES